MKTIVFLDGHGFEKQNNINLSHMCYFLRPSGQGLGSDVFDNTIKSCIKRDIFGYIKENKIKEHSLFPLSVEQSFYGITLKKAIQELNLRHKYTVKQSEDIYNFEGENYRLSFQSATAIDNSIQFVQIRVKGNISIDLSLIDKHILSNYEITNYYTPLMESDGTMLDTKETVESIWGACRYAEDNVNQTDILLGQDSFIKSPLFNLNEDF
jgi:hypothetical protein